MTLWDRDPSHEARTKFRAKRTRYHPKLSSRLWEIQLEKAFGPKSRCWFNRQFIAGITTKKT